MNFEDILSTIHQIEEIVGPGEAGEESTQLDAVQMPLFDMVALAPDAFNVPSGTPSDREVFEVLIEDLYEQLAQGKVVTTLQYFLAGVPPRYLATGKKLDQGRQVALPLPLVVRLIGPEQLKARSCQKRPAPKMRDMPDLFVGSKQAAKPAAPKPAAAPEPVAQEPAPAPAVSVPAPAVAAAPAPAPAPAAAPAPEPVSTRPGIMLPLSEMARILPAFFKLPEDLTAFPDIKFRVEIPDMFAKLALGKIEVRRMDFLINVPSKFLKVVDGAAGDDLIVLPLPVVVSAIAPEEWSKQMKGAPASSRPRVSAIPDLFEAKRPPAKAPAAPAQPPPAAPVEAAPVKEPPKPVVEKPAAPVVKEEKAPAPAPVEKKTPAPEVVQPAKAEVVVEKPAPAKRPEAVAPVPMEEKPAAKPSLDPEAILLRVLGERSARLPDPSEVASRWKDVEGYDGCAIIHREGDLLATSWSHKASDMLEVMAPQIWKRVAGYVDHLDEGTMKSVTVSVSNHLLTFVQSGDLCFVAMHKPGSFDHAHLELAQKLAVELGSRFVTPRREK